MILKLYKSNTTLVLFGLPLIMAVLWAPTFLSQSLVDTGERTLIFNWFYIENPILNRISAFLVILITGILLNSQINKNEIFERNTYIPSLFYILIMSSISEMQQMHPVVLSNLFWVLAYRRLLNVYNQVQCKSEIFDASLFICIATLITFPSAAILLLLPWITLVIIRPFDFREYMMPFFGTLLLLIYLTVYYYVYPVEIKYLNFQSSYSHFHLKFNWTYYVIYGLMVIIMYLSAYKLLSKSNTSSVRFRKTTSVLILLGSVPFSFLWSFYFFYNERKWVGNLLFYTILIFVIGNLYWPLISAYF